jgi:hypothetical protein
VNSVLNLWVPKNAGKLSSGLTTAGLSSSSSNSSIVAQLWRNRHQQK